MAHGDGVPVERGSCRLNLEHGPDAMTYQQLGFLQGLMSSWQPWNLIRDVPEEESWSLTACNTAEERWGLIRDLCNKHRGEAREIQGSWRYVSRPFPVEAKFFHPQYCHTLREAKQLNTWTGKGKPASGGKGGKAGGKRASASGGRSGEENAFLARDSTNPDSGYWLREATVVGLPELFAKCGHMATAKDLYEWWGSARVLVTKRLHGVSNPVRREAAQRRYKETGYWGHGHGRR